MQGWMIDPSSFFGNARNFVFFICIFFGMLCVYILIFVFIFYFPTHLIPSYSCAVVRPTSLLEFVNLFWITYPQTFTSHTDLGTINQQFPQNLSEYHPPIGVWIACLARPPPSLPIATPRLQPRRPHTTPTRGQTVWWLKWIWKLGLLGLAEVAMIPMMEE